MVMATTVPDNNGCGKKTMMVMDTTVAENDGNDSS